MEISASTPVGQERDSRDQPASRKKSGIPQPRWASLPPPPRTAGESDPEPSSDGQISSLPPRKEEAEESPVEQRAPIGTPERRSASRSHLPGPRQNVVQAEFQTPGFSPESTEPQPAKSQLPEDLNGHADTCIEKGMLLDDQWLLFYCPSCSNLIKVDTEHTEKAVACAGCGREFSLEVDAEAE